MMMTRIVSFALFGLGVAALAGCPIYSDDHDSWYYGDCRDDGSCTNRCDYDAQCGSGQFCNESGYCQNSTSNPPPTGGACSKPSDCPAGSTCSSSNRCEAGDCSHVGCSTGYVCKLESGAPQCVPSTKPPPSDGGTSSSCQNDSECASPAGSKCLSGSCVAPQDQCVDATQCPGTSQCVQGACTPSCSADKPCPTGYACDVDKGVCTGDTPSCGPNAACSGGTVCVQERCVAPCGAGGSCGSGLVCVDGGCTPDERPVLVCEVDGQQDKCQPGSICLRHSCYIACSADAGAEACKSADTFNVCKSVTTSSGAHSVCGSDSNLGTECDVAQGQACASPLICIDGFCR